MASNKAKTLASARRLVGKGKLQKAVGMYRRLADSDPADLRLRLELADLQKQAGDLAAALVNFNVVARRYADDGELLKAVAVYKQMLRLDDGLHSVHLALARVYNRLGLVNDAVSQYKQVISVLAARRQGELKLEVIRELLELDPDNVRARVRLAEDFFAEGRTDEGVRELRLAAELLDRAGSIDEFLKVAERLMFHRPDDTVVARRYCELMLGRQSPQEALPRLQLCYKAHPTDAEVLDMLAMAFDQLGQSHKALTVLKELARVHDRNGLVKERDGALYRVLDLDPSDKSARKALGEFEDEAPDVIAFEELDDEDDIASRARASAAPPPPPPPRPMESAALTPSQASFDDLEALAEMVASEPLSYSGLELSSLDSAPGLAPGDGPAVELPPAPDPDEVEEIGFGEDFSAPVRSAKPPAPEVSTFDDVVSGEIDAEALDEADLIVEPDEVSAPRMPLPPAVVSDLEEADFYLRNNLVAAARGVLDDLPEEFAEHPEVQRRLAAVVAGDA